MSILGKDISQLSKTHNVLENDLFVIEKPEGTKAIAVKDIKAFFVTTGPQGPMGPAGPQGLTGPQGQTGPAGATGSKGSTGEKGDQGEKGEKGDRGQDGTSITIIDYLQDVSQLPPPSSHLHIGTAYGVNGYLYIYNGVEWKNFGRYRGDQGETGPAGTDPHIDPVSGNWFVGTHDTGVKAQGPKGDSSDVDLTPVEDKITEIKTQLGAHIFWSGTKAEFDMIVSKDPNTIYFVEE